MGGLGALRGEALIGMQELWGGCASHAPIQVSGVKGSWSGPYYEANVSIEAALNGVALRAPQA